MTELQVREANLTDVDAVVPLFDAYRQFYGQRSDLAQAREFLIQRLQRQESTVFLANDEPNSALGFAQLFPSFSSVALARTFVLNDLFVTASARRRGVAQALLEAVVAFSKAAGAIRLTLSTQTTNTAAQRLYTLSGWSRQVDYHVYSLKL